MLPSDGRESRARFLPNVERDGAMRSRTRRRPLGDVLWAPLVCVSEGVLMGAVQRRMNGKAIR